MVLEGTVLKMVRVERTIRMQELHYLSSGPCMRGIAHNFDPIITNFFIFLANGPRMGEFKYDPYKVYGLYNISNTHFHGNI